MTEPPFIGTVYQAVRSKSGRRWEVIDHDPRWGWRLWPMGIGSTRGGGVKAIWRKTAELRDRKRWRMMGITRRAL